MVLRSIISTCFAVLVLSLPSARAEPVLKIINFTADWCPNCHILNPRLAEAVSEFPASEIEIIDLDLTRMSAEYGEQARATALADAASLADTHHASALWQKYGPTTGLAAIIAADTGEVIACAMRPMRADDIADQLKLAKILAKYARPGNRTPDHINCPTP